MPEQADTNVHGGYERTDVRIAPLIWLGLTVFLGSVAVFVVLWLLLVVLERQAERADPQKSPLAQTDRQPPLPRLQKSPVEDLQALNARDEAILTSYGWADEERQAVRIPVSRAMELAVERGLPRPIPPDSRTGE
ncbi:MAG TPA: hypothetical protein VFB96_24360 [Pirellulaceae bacterium]|nr:hypothetical protein [Pirellulaceae bacterium]